MKEMMRVVGVILVLSSCCLSLLDAQQITHPTDVSALQYVHRKLKDPLNHLQDWKKTDPCASNWTGVICIPDPTDGFLHVKELRLLNMNLTGQLAPELGLLSNLTILNFMWNDLTGQIPPELGNLTHLIFLLLSGNQLTGSLPQELGSLSNLLILQIDYNEISGKLPTSLANLKKLKHFHMNNNSITGQIPPEFSSLTSVLHFLMDNNKLTGNLPPELSQMPSLRILQLDGNNFDGTEIPSSYGSIPNLVKLSLRNCNLKGPIPDLSKAPVLYYLDISSNKLTGEIPKNKFSANITTINLYNNMLNGSIPSNFSGLPRLQRLQVQNNNLSGEIPVIWENRSFKAEEKLILDLRNNMFSNVSSVLLNPPSNVTVKLYGNPVCANVNAGKLADLCGVSTLEVESPATSSETTTTGDCKRQSCPVSENYDYVIGAPVACFCAAPLGIELRLRSPSFSDFRPYKVSYMLDVASPKNLGINAYQISIETFAWQSGPRLSMNMKIFPEYSELNSKFNTTEVQRIVDFFATFSLDTDDSLGPYEIISINTGAYRDEVTIKFPEKSGMSKGGKVGIILGAIALFIVLSSVALVCLIKRSKQKRKTKEVDMEQEHPIPKSPINMESVKGYTLTELDSATSSFSDLSQIGRGGYGKVYKGHLPGGLVVAVKRAEQGSLQGQKEFFTEIELLSRLHHRNLVSLLGYCDQKGEQMLVYEYMPNGSLQDALSARFRQPLSLALRLRIALGSARGILYLHTEADPPIIHRDIKPSNILLDSKMNPKVADFGISKLIALDGGGVQRDHVTTIVKGTPGYVDPEYYLSHRLTEKSDVYSLGIVFLEILTGMRPISHGRNIVREVNEACEAGMMMSVIDGSMGQYSEECVKRFMELAIRCCQDNPEARPRMLEIVRELENIYGMIPKEEKPYSSPSVQSSASGMSGFAGASARGSYTTFSEFTGNQLVSGVIPSIAPR
ncbi:Leucine-rich repeat-containing N-terminal plant-type [Arabidopsis thaliana x Arabidopsis arenosa]|uniref:non-specific serine/threonine protein kinase n=1 Tax=Arabidopsis thaliana x Arabidopsis arenosa TaxID=1240361 RepID=A0A8T1Y8X8_9BRAS|nr:Leucine-rich repeat-containing N-terminal plant-type [Arabidopsis thaliana x Arabidopsis arenosa]